jgi:hypothetical protein
MRTASAAIAAQRAVFTADRAMIIPSPITYMLAN